VEYVTPKIAAQVGAVLKSQRPTNFKPIDLSATRFKNADWRGVNLSGIDISGIVLAWVDLKDANLDNINSFDGALFFHTAWWEARKISPELRGYLEASLDATYRPTSTYGPRNETFTPAQYAAELERLKNTTK
jgi:hypothetical protein